MAEMVGVRQAARELGLSASTVTRYLRQYPELNHAAEREAPRIDLAELRRHRAENVNPAMKGNHAGLLQDQIDEAREAIGQAEAGRPAGSKTPGNTGNSDHATLTKARSVREAARAREAQLDLAQRLGELVPRREVEEAAHQAGQKLLQMLRLRNPDLGDQLARVEDPREIQRILDEADRQLLNAFAKAMTRIAAEQRGEESGVAA